MQTARRGFDADDDSDHASFGQEEDETTETRLSLPATETKNPEALVCPSRDERLRSERRQEEREATLSFTDGPADERHSL